MFLSGLVFIAVLTVLVLIHELGHYAVARLSGVRVEEFGLGLPPRIWGKKFGKTVYSVNWLPIGGFVRLAGEDDEEEASADIPKSRLHEYFFAKPKKVRAAILIAGVVMNFLLAVAITAFLLVDGIRIPGGFVTIERVSPGSPAAVAGISPGDIIRAGTPQSGIRQEFTDSEGLIRFARENGDRSVTLSIDRSGEALEVIVIPRKSPPEGEGPLGIAITDLVLKRYSLLEAPVESVRVNLDMIRQMVTGIGKTIYDLVTLKNTRPDVAGPIGIAQVTSQAVKFGWRAVLELSALLSLNLAVLNILPFPALDGGRLMFVFLEKVLGRKVKPAFEKSTHQIGMILLLALLALISVQDVLRITRGG